MNHVLVVVVKNINVVMEDKMQIKSQISAQHSFFNSGKTRDVNYRVAKLKELKKVITNNENIIIKALQDDLGKPELEAYATEVGFVLREITLFINNTIKWAKPKKAIDNLINFPSKSYIMHEPYGLMLIISPWNYPFQLCMSPLIGAISAGNCVALKPSEFAPNTSSVIKQIISEVFDSSFVSVFEGDATISQELLNQKFNYIFFTGSDKVAKIVMNNAAKNLTPITLELGGKSPCIVDQTADINLAAKRITWGKFINAGQTCLAPDYILAHSSIKKELINNIKKCIRDFYGTDIKNCGDYTRIINEIHFDRLSKLIEKQKVVFGGKIARKNLFIEPTLMDEVTWDDDIMKQEIFGPLLPFIEYNNIESIISKIQNKKKSLGLYLFTSNKETEKLILNSCSFGGGCINDTISHVANSNLPFGGVGNSGMGCYHGKYSFETFSHKKSIVKKASWIDIPLRYPPYKGKLKWVKKILG